MTEDEAAAAPREELPRQKCSEHQAFLSFVNDDEGIAFREWWLLKGAAAFADWLADRTDLEGE